jgi:hypothetical protein
VKKACGISSIARQLQKVSEKVDSLAMGIQDMEQSAPDVMDVYTGLLMDEVEHIQILTLELTKLVFGIVPDEANADEGDGSVFAAGDLTAGKAGKDGDDDEGRGEVKR